MIIDKDMLINAAETNVAEALGLLSWRLLFYFTFLFALPSFVIYKVKIIQQSAGKRILDHFGVALLAIVSFALILLASSNFSISFFREQKQIPLYSNPLSSLYASYEIIHKTFFRSHKLFKHIGDDAHISGLHKDRELIILVIGETARADRFSLNGYIKNTNPKLSRQSVVSFNNVSSCGTSTRISVPCIFSIEGKDKFELSKFK